MKKASESEKERKCTSCPRRIGTKREKGLFPEIIEQQIWCLFSCPHFQKVLWCSGLECEIKNLKSLLTLTVICMALSMLISSSMK